MEVGLEHVKPHILGTTWRLAFRNVRRSPARSLLTFGAIFFGVFMTIVLAGFGNGLGILMRSDIINSKLGAIQVHRRGYSELRDNQPLHLSMRDDGPLQEVITRSPGVRAVAPRLVFAGMINNGRDATVFIGRGIDADYEYRVLTWARGDVIGQPVSAARKHSAVLGAELARGLQLKQGDSATVETTTLGGQQNALDIDVAGVLDNATAFEAKRFAQLPLAFVQELLGMPHQVTEFVVGVSDVDHVENIAARLRQHLGTEYEVTTWADLEPNVADVLDFQTIVIGMIGLIFLAIAFFGVVNTMLMSVMERSREIGTMMALGLRRRFIVMVFLEEAILLSILAAALGFGAARLFEWVVAAHGGFVVATPGSTVERYHLIPHASGGMIVFAVVGAVVASVGAAAYPAWKAATLRPVEALRAV